MPIDGFPDPQRHRLCVRCHKWHNPHEGVTLYPEAGGPIQGLRIAAAEAAGDESAMRFMCFRCIRTRRYTKAALFGAFVAMVVIVFTLPRFGLIDIKDKTLQVSPTQGSNQRLKGEPGAVNASFEPQPEIEELAKAYSLDAVDFAAQNFEIRLDFSEDSIRLVEQILGNLHDTMPQANPDEKRIWDFAKCFGSYVGEVYRKKHGGRWGTITHGGQEYPGIQGPGETYFWPWARAYKRIVEGPEENVWHYYQVLIEPKGKSKE